MTITIAYGSADDTGLNLVADVKVKTPARPRPAQFIYADEKGKTYQDDPHQAELPITFEPRVVGGKKTRLTAGAE